jgi:sphingomyelin phosphodiesterase
MRSRWLLTVATAAFYSIGCANANLVDDIVNAITGAVDCGSCHALLLPLAGLALIGDAAFSDTIIAVCKTLGVS